MGHSDVAFTIRQYVETDLEADREVANTLAELIIGGDFLVRSGRQVGAGWRGPGRRGPGRMSASFTDPFTNHKQKAGSLFENRP